MGWFDFTNYIFGRYSIIPTWCAHHDIHYALQFDSSFEPKWPRASFPVPDSKTKIFFVIYLAGFNLWFWIKLASVWENWSLGPSGQNVVSRPQIQSSGHFRDFLVIVVLFYDSGENEVLFVKIGARGFWTYGLICLLWS